MKKSRVLREAKKLLWDGVTFRNYRYSKQFVCLCIQQVTETGDIRKELEQAVQDKMYTGSNLFTGHLRIVMGDQAVDSMPVAEIQSLRHILINELITEYEQRGE